MRVPSVLAKMWPVIAWLDRARWYRMEGCEIPGPVFERLTPAEQVLTHWLCYVLDAQRSYREVWEKGGPSLSELVRDHARTQRPPLAILRDFSRRAPEGRKVDLLTSRRQRVGSELIALAPRYGMHLFSVAATLVGLARHRRNLAQYLADYWPFCQAAPGARGDDRVHRVAFLLFLLTYWRIPHGLPTLRDAAFSDSVAARERQRANLLRSPAALEEVPRLAGLR